MNILKRFTNFIENGDLIPLLILVSVPHYIQVLKAYDFVYVAAALGLLLDIGFYRTIKLWMKGKGITWMLVMTVFSAGFHIAFYDLGGAGWLSLILGLAPMAAILALAFITRTEKLDAKPKDTAKPLPVAEHDAPVAVPRMDKAQFEVLWQANRQNGHKSVAVMSEELGIPERTMYRWVKSIEDRGELHD